MSSAGLTAARTFVTDDGGRLALQHTLAIRGQPLAAGGHWRAHIFRIRRDMHEKQAWRRTARKTSSSMNDRSAGRPTAAQHRAFVVHSARIQSQE
jgi:hypothetical protein